MGISRYLAMTAAEMETFSLPENASVAYMACHFSPYSTGLSNIPNVLPSDSMLIVNDLTPLHGHDPKRIARQLAQTVQQLQCSSVLLDFQRPDIPETKELCKALSQDFPCPIGVSDLYAQDLNCPVFLSPVPLDQGLREYVALWDGRELWLDIAPEAACIIVTEQGSTMTRFPFSPAPEDAFTDESLHCLYRSEVFEKEIRFSLWRDLPQLEELLEEAEALGITRAIGLYQQIHRAK